MVTQQHMQPWIVENDSMLVTISDSVIHLIRVLRLLGSTGIIISTQISQKNTEMAAIRRVVMVYSMKCDDSSMPYQRWQKRWQSKWDLSETRDT
jgi:hypothetical protein